MSVPDRAGTRLFAVAGDPVAHSLSPAMHNAAIQALGIDATYVAARTTARAFPALVRGTLEAGGGLNVTMPLKADACALVVRATEAVQRTGACNTIWGDPEQPRGDNTDVEGMRVVLRGTGARGHGGTEGRGTGARGHGGTEGRGTGARGHGGTEGRGTGARGHGGTDKAIVQGTGGAARAVAIALGEEYPGIEIAVISRDASRAEAFAQWAVREGVRCRPWQSGESAPLYVRAVPAGYPVPSRDAFAGVIRAIDLVYAKGETEFVRVMRAEGKTAEDGRGLLVAQGAAAFRHFFGVEAPIEVMRQAVEDALRP